MLKLLPFLILLSACSYHAVKEDADVSSGYRERELSGSKDISCYEVAKIVLDKSGNNISGKGAVAYAFDVNDFDNYFSKLSAQGMFQQFNDSVLKNDVPTRTAKRLDKIVAKLEKSSNPIASVKKLSPSEKKVLWFATVKPQLEAADEEILKELAQNGDEVSSLLLQIPRGTKRNNVESAVTLMKRIDPEASDGAIVGMIRKNMSVCLR